AVSVCAVPQARDQESEALKPTTREDAGLTPTAQDPTATLPQQETTAKGQTENTATTPPPEPKSMPPENVALPAAGTTASVQAKFDALDVNHDGTIDRKEAAASEVLSAQFDALDKKHDGRLDLSEFAAATDLALIKVDKEQRRE